MSDPIAISSLLDVSLGSLTLAKLLSALVTLLICLLVVRLLMKLLQKLFSSLLQSVSTVQNDAWTKLCSLQGAYAKLCN